MKNFFKTIDSDKIFSLFCVVICIFICALFIYEFYELYTVQSTLNELYSTNTEKSNRNTYDQYLKDNTEYIEVLTSDGIEIPIKCVILCNKNTDHDMVRQRSTFFLFQSLRQTCREYSIDQIFDNKDAFNDKMITRAFEEIEKDTILENKIFEMDIQIGYPEKTFVDGHICYSKHNF